VALPQPLEQLFDAFALIAWRDIAWSIGVLVVSIAVALAVAKIAVNTVVRWARGTESVLDDEIVGLLRRPTRLLIVFGLLSLTRPLAVIPSAPSAWIRHALLIGVIVSLGWLAVRVVRVAETVIERQFSLADAKNLSARALHTKVRGFGNIAGFIAGLVTVCLVLMSFDSVRQVGVSLLASAGIAGVVIGFAAQRSIATLVAGVQIALTQPIRVDDVVIVEGEWGHIEEIRLTYVVIRIWDLRRLVVPITYFIEKPFQNWTRTSADLLGVVAIHVDFRLPVEEARAELERILKASTHWDRKAWGLQITESTDRTMVIRPLFSAADSSKQWDLRCEVREKLISWIQRDHPACLPQLRTQLDGRPQAA
jgi:small-conductance mechanosensitive channel